MARPTTTVAAWGAPFGGAPSGNVITNQTTFTYVIFFSQPVTGFTASEVSVSNGTVTSFAAQFPANPYNGGYYVTVTRTGQGDVSLSVGENVANNSSGEQNLGSNTYVWTHDSVAPTVSLSSSTVSNGQASNSASHVMTATWSEPVRWPNQNFSLTNCSISNLAGTGASQVYGGNTYYTTYTFTVTPFSEGLVQVTVPSSRGVDKAGNFNSTASSAFSFRKDTVAPWVQISGSIIQGSATNQSVNSMTATFSEAVTGFASGDIQVTNGAVSNFAGSGSVYTFDVTASQDGAVEVVIPSGCCQDLAGNALSSQSTFSWVLDTVAPTATITASVIIGEGQYLVGPTAVNVELSEEVADFYPADDIQITNGFLSNISQTSSTEWVFIAEPLDDGEMTVSAAAALFSDAGGNQGVTIGEPLSYPVSLPLFKENGGSYFPGSVTAGQVSSILSRPPSKFATLAGIAQASDIKRVLGVWVSAEGNKVVCSFKQSGGVLSGSKFRCKIPGLYEFQRFVVVKNDHSHVVVNAASITLPELYNTQAM